MLAAPAATAQDDEETTTTTDPAEAASDEDATEADDEEEADEASPSPSDDAAADKAREQLELQLDPELVKAIDALVDKRVQERLDAELDKRMEQTLQRKKSQGFFQFEIPKTPVKFELRGDFFTKFLNRNNQSGGCVTYGNPAPEGDNFSGDNGICSELSLTLRGWVSDRVEVGARLASRYGAQWANYWENGDLRNTGLDGSGESLGMNHAAYIQLRGLYLRAAPPIPTLKYVHLGSSDLGMFNPWTIGKIRFTERDNARGIFIHGEFGGPWLQYTFARVALPKLWASAGYNTGIDDPLVQNPFWERDAAYALKLKTEWEWFSVEQITSYVLDEEADLDDPDAIGSTNTLDPKDGVTITNPRYQNLVATLEGKSEYLSWLNLKVLGGYSLSATHPDHVFNSVSGSQGFSPVPMGFHPFGYTAVGRLDFLLDPLLQSSFEMMDINDGESPLLSGLELHFEYFNIGSEWVSVMGSRREADVLLTDGFLDGQVPTLNVANEFQDFTEPFYESIIGWHGVTALLSWSPSETIRSVPVDVFSYWPVDMKISGEGTFVEYNTDTGDQPRDTKETYPDFLYTDGMTDTWLYSYANTNDRGRDPRSVYKEFQNRNTIIGVLKGDFTLDVDYLSSEAWTDWVPRLTLSLKHKTIVDNDLRNPTIEGDEYNGLLFFNTATLSSPITDELGLTVGYSLDYWMEQGRSGDVIAGVPNYPDYNTLRQRAFADIRYAWGGLTLWYHIEYVNKDVATSDDRLNFSYRHILRSIGMVTASF
jgi:hypothetical protein